jgi:hypothetical protein
MNEDRAGQKEPNEDALNISITSAVHSSYSISTVLDTVRHNNRVDRSRPLWFSEAL